MAHAVFGTVYSPHSAYGPISRVYVTVLFDLVHADLLGEQAGVRVVDRDAVIDAIVDRGRRSRPARRP